MAKRFNWSKFDISLIQSIAKSDKTPASKRVTFSTEDKLLLLPYMESICPRPNHQFVRRYWEELTEHFFAGSKYLVSLMRELEKLHYRGVFVGSNEAMLAQFKKLRLTSTVLDLILAELYRAGDDRVAEDDEFSVFTSPKTLDLKACVPGELPLYDYQQEAVDSLTRFFLEEHRQSGILVMPTGSGKTRVASRFLIEKMVASGYQVLWLTHRAMLIEQTATSIYNAAGALLPTVCPDKERFSMICVSGSHASIRAAEKSNDVMILGVQSLVRNLPFLQALLQEKVFIVVDEAHHTLAPSYRAILSEIRRLRPAAKLLGLTATPVRMSQSGTARLMGLFDHRIIYSVAMSTLIAKGYLSQPNYITVDTKIDFDTTISLDEQRYIRKWGELSPETMDRIADLAKRNRLIVDTYLSRREESGKTLIFALNGVHCKSLCEELQKNGVACDYIYSAHEGNEEKIAKFQRGELDVLVNINILSEGSDVPDIQTVFLTRPTSSDVLLMQMIGRGMRGRGSGGTETVNIVDFQDQWGSFAHWLTPEFLLTAESAEEDAESRSASKPGEMVPWEMLRDLFDAVEIRINAGSSLDSHAVLPVGWYDVLDEDGNDAKVLVFESQLAGYKDMWEQKERLFSNREYSGTDALNEFFGGFGLLPTAYELQLVLDTYRISGDMPHLFQLADRKKIDAAYLAQEIKEENVGARDLDGFIRSRYKESALMIDSIYDGEETFVRRVKEFVLFPDGKRPLGMRIEEVEEGLVPFDPTPAYDLKELTEEVLEDMFDGSYGKVPPISWTDKAYKGYFGQYIKVKGGTDFIRINRILNSKDVPREAVKYVIYHELLHRDYWYHDKQFRAKEHLFPNWTEQESFLDGTFPKFDLEEAM